MAAALRDRRAAATAHHRDGRRSTAGQRHHQRVPDAGGRRGRAPTRARDRACARTGLIVGGRPPGVELRLEHEAKLVELVEPLDGAAGRRLEASGVLAKDDGFYVIFDNLPDIVRLGPGLVAGAPENHVFTQERREADGLRGHRLRSRLRSVLRADRGAAGPAGDLPGQGAPVRRFPALPAQRLAGLPAGRREQGPGGVDLSAPQRPDLSAGHVRGQPVPGRVGGTTAGRRPDPGVHRGGSARRLGPHRHHPAAGHARVRGLQRHRSRR